MKHSFALLCLVLLVSPEAAMAGSRKTTSSPVNPVTITSGQNFVNPAGSTINGGTGAAITVTGSGNTIVNQGTITGSTGISITGSGSNNIVNTGTISVSSTGQSGQSTAVGVKTR